MYVKSTRTTATIKSRAPVALKLARDENVPAKREEFFSLVKDEIQLFVFFLQEFLALNQKRERTGPS